MYLPVGASGVVEVYMASTSPTARLVVDSCQFQGNILNSNSTIVGVGGAISSYAPSTNITNSTFLSNTNSGYGSAVFINNSASSASVAGSRFQYNTGCNT